MQTIIIDENYRGITKDEYGRLIYEGDLKIDHNVKIDANFICRGNLVCRKEYFTIFGVKTNRYLHITIANYYTIIITDEIIKIGCKQYTRKQWTNFTDSEIDAMDSGKSIEFWNKYKRLILEA